MVAAPHDINVRARGPLGFINPTEALLKLYETISPMEHVDYKRDPTPLSRLVSPVIITFVQTCNSFFVNTLDNEESLNNKPCS